jgi:hypothetical protein
VLARLPGTYEDGTGFTLTIALDADGAPVASLLHQPPAPLAWLEGARFRATARSSVTLELVGAPEASALELRAGGRVIHLPRKK